MKMGNVYTSIGWLLLTPMLACIPLIMEVMVYMLKKNRYVKICTYIARNYAPGCYRIVWYDVEELASYGY